jgi:hypothetical protein
MSRTPTTHPEPGPECVCGSELRALALPADLAAISGQLTVWVHVETGDTRCYPESTDPEVLAATGEPL